jgi:hypothetical protein
MIQFEIKKITVLGLQFKWAGPFSDGLAVVKIANRYSDIDRSGKVVIQAKFAAAKGFSEF